MANGGMGGSGAVKEASKWQNASQLS